MNNNNIIYANKRKKGEEKPITRLYDITISHNAEEPDYFRLDEVPLRYIKNIIKCDANGAETNIILQEQIGGVPTTGKFVVNYDMGTIYVNDADNVRKIKVSYLGTGSVLLASDVNELSKIHENVQEKLTPSGSLIIDEDEYYWSNFAEDRYLYITQAIPSFTKLNIVFEASLVSKDEDDSTLMCQGYITEQNTNQAEEKLIGLQVNTTKPGLYSNDQWILGNLNSELREKYFYCINSEDGQTFTIYSLKKDNYDLYNLPSFEFWNEECTFTEDIFTNQNFYIGYNQFTPSKYFHGRIFGCLITLDDEVFFDLNKAQVGVDYINNNCTYTGEIENPTILSPELKSGTNINLLNTEDSTYINFKGSHYIVKAVYDEEIEDERTLIISEPISESTCIFLNGQLLTYGLDYTYEVLENPGNDKPKIKLIFSRIIDHKIVLPDPDSEPIDIMDSSIFIVPGLSYTYLGELSGNNIYVGRNIQQNTLVFRNGILQYNSSDLSLETGYIVVNGNTLRFNTGEGSGDLNHDDISIIFNYNNKLSAILDEPTDSYDFGVNLPDNTLVFRNGQLIGQYVDWDKERDNNGKYTNNSIIKFTSMYNTNEWLVASIQPSDAIYNAIGDKQDRLPKLVQNKVLGTDGNSVMWVDPNFGEIDYANITNKPQINDIEINGNQNSEYYGLQSKIPVTGQQNKILSNDGSSLMWMQIDNELRLDRINPVQNVVITTALNGKQNTINGAASTVTNNNLATSKAVVSNASGKIAASETTSTEISYVHGVTSAIQTQLDNKQATITGALEDITNTTLTADKALKSDSNGKVTTANVTATELEYLSGVTSGVQNQIDSKQNKIAAGTANNILAYSGTAGTVNTLNRVITINDSTNASDTAIPTEKAIRTQLDTKQDTLDINNKLSTDFIDGLANVATIGTYGSLVDKPKLNGHVIDGDKTAEDYDIIVSSNLFDIKLKEDTNPDINWACISKKTTLNATTNPAAYNELLNRYQDLELTVDNTFTTVTNNNIQNANVKIINNEIYLFRNVSNKIGLYKCPINDINNFTLVFELSANIGLVDSCWGNDTLLVRTDDNNLYLYETETFQLEDSFQIGNIISGGYNKISYLPNTNKYLFTTPITDEDYPIELYILGLNDDPTPQWSITALANIQYDIKNITFIKDITEIDTNTNEEVNKTIYMFGYNNGLYQTDDITDLTTYTELVSNCNGNFVKINKVILTEGNNGNSKVSYDEGQTWTTNTLGGSSVVSYKIKQINNNLVIVMAVNSSNSIIYRSTDLFNFIELSDNSTIMDFDSLDFNNNLLILTSGTNYSYNEYQIRQYTKTYTINSNTYTITYYVSAKTQTKIVYGTTQNSTLDTVFNYLGYLDYFVLDDTAGSENITLPRTKILWTYMYVSDNYIDIGIPNGNYTPIEVQINKTDTYNTNSEITYPSSKALKDGLDTKENVSNKVTSISASSTDTQYPSAKLVYDQLATKQNNLTTQTIYTTKGTSKKVAQITTNNLGQVTNITEIDITHPTLTWYDVAGGDFQANDTEIQTNLDNVMKVYNNGLLLRVNVDYTTSLVNNKVKITFTTALLATDQVAVESL